MTSETNVFFGSQNLSVTFIRSGGVLRNTFGLKVRISAFYCVYMEYLRAYLDVLYL